MPVPRGYRHSDEARMKMSASRKGVPHSDARKLKISEANRGRVAEKSHTYLCACGVTFKSASLFAKYCSLRCRRAASGHGRIHAPQFSHFKRECAVCGGTASLVGDHEHATGRARGVLCRPCNLAIGNMCDDPTRLRRAADYLEGN